MKLIVMGVFSFKINIVFFFSVFIVAAFWENFQAHNDILRIIKKRSRFYRRMEYRYQFCRLSGPVKSEPRAVSSSQV